MISSSYVSSSMGSAGSTTKFREATSVTGIHRTNFCLATRSPASGLGWASSLGWRSTTLPIRETIEHAYAAARRRNEPPKPVATGGLVALYRFTERSGSTIADSSPRPPILLTIPKRVERVRAFLSHDSQLLSWPSSPYGLIDGVVNLLIFVPFGLLGCIVSAARSWTLQHAIGTTVATAALLSFVAESIQYFWFPDHRNWTT